MGKTGIVRSKLGCYGCRNYKKKCGGEKPACKFCVRGKKTCVYPLLVTIADASSTRADHYFSLLKPTIKLTETRKLLFSYFVANAGEFFSQGLNQNLCVFWDQEVPNLFLRHPCVREAIFATTAIYLHTHYSRFSDHLLQNKQSLDTLKAESDRAFRKLIKHLLNQSTPVNESASKALLVSNYLLFSYIYSHPTLNIEMVNYSHSPGQLDLTDLRRSQQRVTSILAERFRGKDICLLYDTDLLLQNYERREHNIALFVYLKQYVAKHSDFNSRWIYSATIQTFETLLGRCIDCSSFLPLFRLYSAALFYPEEHDELLKRQDYIAMKVIFYLCVFFQVSPYTFTGPNSIWGRFMNLYIEMWSSRDPIDTLVFNSVINLKAKFNPEDMIQLEFFGSELVNINNHLL